MENIKQIAIMLKISLSLLGSYYKYKKKPKYSFFIIKFANGTSEIVLYKDAYRLQNSIVCYNMHIFNKVQKDDMLFDLDDWSQCLGKLIPVWNFRTLYSFIKLCKKREKREYLYEYSLIIENRKLKKFLKNKVIK